MELRGYHAKESKEDGAATSEFYVRWVSSRTVRQAWARRLARVKKLPASSAETGLAPAADEVEMHDEIESVAVSLPETNGNWGTDHFHARHEGVVYRIRRKHGNQSGFQSADDGERQRARSIETVAELSFSNPVGALAYQGEELLTRFLFVAEAAQHRGRYRGGVLLLDAAHHHAEVAGFDDYGYTLWFDHSLNRFRNLCSEALLDLEAAGEEFDQARDFAEADHFAVGDVGHVHFSEEGQQVMLAEAEHFDVFDDDHFVVGDGEERAFEQGFGIFGVAAG
jgi:hypothetical protein